MKKNNLGANSIIAVSVLFIVIVTLLFTFDTREVIQPEKEKENKVEYSIGAPPAARTPSGLTHNNEREDICKWAIAQDGYYRSSRSPITAFHLYYKKSSEAWCQMFMNWCSEQAGTSASNFVRSSFACQTCLAGYNSLNGSYRKATKSATPEKGWLIYETYSSKPNHVGMYVGGGQWAHGNYNGGYVDVVSKNYGTFVSYAKPYYRSKIIYNTNQTGATYNGYTYPNNYSTWYTEEKGYTLSTSGPTASGKTFQGWYKESSCSNKRTTIGTGEKGAIYVYAKWSGGSDGGGGSTTPPPTDDVPTEKPPVYWSISHYPNGGYFTGSYPTWYEEGVGCSIPQYNVARTGYTFKGWYDNSYGYRYRIYASDSGDKHLYAQWTPNKYPLNLYTERGKVKDGSYSFTDLGGNYYKYSKQYTYDTVEYLPTQPNGIDRRGHTFEGWYKNSKYSGSTYTNLPKGTIGEQTFYAKWEPITYDLILHKNGGTCVNPRIDNGVVVGDDIVGTYTYAQGSTFPKANDDIYKKDRIFAGWYENSSLSGTPQTGIRSGDDDTAPIGDKEYWARWIGIIPNTPANDATETINAGKEMVLYVYFTYRIDTDASGNVTNRVSTPTAKNKRHFSVDLTVDTNPGTSSQVKVWLSTSKDPANTAGRLNWACTTKKSKSWNNGTKQFTTTDNNTIKYTCPNNIESFIGGSGSRKVYVHVESVTGNVGTYPVNLVKRALYKQH